MICPVCKMRWADYPVFDWRIDVIYGIKARFNDSYKRRTEVFNSNEEIVCSDECREVLRRIEIGLILK